MSAWKCLLALTVNLSNPESPPTKLLKAGARRFRGCLRCGREFTTTERVDPVPLTVVKRDGRREEFNRGKLRDKISTACWKRPVSSEQIGQIVGCIERGLT